MVKAALVILIFCSWYVLGKSLSQSSAFVGRPLGAASATAFTAPTNEPEGSGANIISWWLDTDYTTNGSIATLPDHGTGAHGWDLTNAATAISPSLTSTGLLFTASASQYLRNTNYSASQPHEVVIVMQSLTATNLTFKRFYSGTDSTGSSIHTLSQSTANSFRGAAGAAIDFMTAKTNALLVIDIVYDNTRGRIYTNGVLAASGSIGTAADVGMTVAASYDLAGNSTMIMREMVTYSATNSVLSRSNLYHYFKNIKGYTLP